MRGKKKEKKDEKGNFKKKPKEKVKREVEKKQSDWTQDAEAHKSALKRQDVLLVTSDSSSKGGVIRPVLGLFVGRVVGLLLVVLVRCFGGFLCLVLLFPVPLPPAPWT